MPRTIDKPLETACRRLARKRFPDDDITEPHVRAWITRCRNSILDGAPIAGLGALSSRPASPKDRAKMLNDIFARMRPPFPYKAVPDGRFVSIEDDQGDWVDDDDAAAAWRKMYGSEINFAVLISAAYQADAKVVAWIDNILGDKEPEPEPQPEPQPKPKPKSKSKPTPKPTPSTSNPHRGKEVPNRWPDDLPSLTPEGYANTTDTLIESWLGRDITLALGRFALYWCVGHVNNRKPPTIHYSMPQVVKGKGHVTCIGMMVSIARGITIDEHEKSEAMFSVFIDELINVMRTSPNLFSSEVRKDLKSGKILLEHGVMRPGHHMILFTIPDVKTSVNIKRCANVYNALARLQQNGTYVTLRKILYSHPAIDAAILKIQSETTRARLAEVIDFSLYHFGKGYDLVPLDGLDDISYRLSSLYASNRTPGCLVIGPATAALMMILWGIVPSAKDQTDDSKWDTMDADGKVAQGFMISQTTALSYHIGGRGMQWLYRQALPADDAGADAWDSALSHWIHELPGLFFQHFAGPVSEFTETLRRLSRQSIDAPMHIMSAVRALPRNVRDKTDVTKDYLMTFALGSDDGDTPPFYMTMDEVESRGAYNDVIHDLSNREP